jgi:hypothetical protein
MSSSSSIASDAEDESSESKQEPETVASSDTSSIYQAISSTSNEDEHCINCCPMNPETIIGKELLAMVNAAKFVFLKDASLYKKCGCL